MDHLQFRAGLINEGSQIGYLSSPWISSSVDIGLSVRAVRYGWWTTSRRKGLQELLHRGILEGVRGQKRCLTWGRPLSAHH